MSEFLDYAITIIFFFWLMILSKRIDLLESSNIALKESGLMLAKEIDRLAKRVAELEKDGDHHEEP